MPDTKTLGVIYLLLFGSLLYALSVQRLWMAMMILPISLLLIWGAVNAPLLKGKDVGEFIDLVYFTKLNSLPLLAVVLSLSTLFLPGI